MNVCRSCKQPIRWVRVNATGRAMPLDVEPDVRRGNVQVHVGGRVSVLPPDVAAQERAAGRELYLSHFATCEHAADHRKAS